MPTNELVLEVLDSNKLAVISTFGDDYPESAVLELAIQKILSSFSIHCQPLANIKSKKE